MFIKKQDRLWIKELHFYYIKHHNILTIYIPNRLSCYIKKILASRQIFLEYQVTSMLMAPFFSIKKLYLKIQGEHTQVRWKRIICNNKASPRALFVTWSARHSRLATKARLFKWWVTLD